MMSMLGVATHKAVGMASVRKRSWQSGGENKVAWVVDYFDQDRKRHIETFQKKKDADARCSEIDQEVRAGTHTAASSSITVAEAADLWLNAAERNKLERSTVKQYRNHVDHHLNPLLGRMKLSSLTTPIVQKFADDLFDRPCADDPEQKLSRAMAKKVLASLKGIIKEAQRKGRIAKNPAQPVSIKVPKRGTRKIRAGRDFPSKSEVNTILQKAAGRWRPLIVTAIFTGMRSSELRGLRWEDVDLDARAIHVRQRADAWGAMGAPKSEAGERTIAMTPMVVNTLKEWKLQCPRKGRGKTGEDDLGELELVFPNGEGNPESHANIANRGFYPLLVACGIAEKVGEDEEGEPIFKANYGLHTLRHFFASWLIEQGFSPKKVQGMLGHSSMQMTYDVYGHLFPNLEDDHAKMAAGEAALTG
jgi:integrase